MNRIQQAIYSLLLFLIIYSSCTEDKPKAHSKTISESVEKLDFSIDDFSEQLKSVLELQGIVPDTILSKQLPTLKDVFLYAYQDNEYQPIWIDEAQNIDKAKQLISELDSLEFEGIRSQGYDLLTIKKYSERISLANATLSDLITFDTLCTKAYLRASRDVLLGVHLPASSDPQWHHSNDSAWNIATTVHTMLETKQYHSLDSFKSRWAVYHSLKEASVHYHELKKDSLFNLLKSQLTIYPKDSILTIIIQKEMPWLETSSEDSISTIAQLLKGYQYYFGQRMSGKFDSATFNRMSMPIDSVLQQIAVNQERIRWMNQIPEPTHIMVPLGLMEFFLNRDGEQVVHMRAVIGKTTRPTPTLNATMVNVVLNPPWGVPPTILKKEVGPGVVMRGAAYLARKGLKAYDSKGKLVDASRINKTNFNRFAYKQAPGERNALGVIKFNMPNKWDIYLHDTPHKEDFPNRNRAKSSGCIRLQHPRDLGEYILAQMESGNRLTRAKIDSIFLTRKTIYMPLKNRIPVHIVYLTAYPDSNQNHLRLLDDLYHRDGALAEKL